MSGNLPTVRCSSLPLLERCTGAAYWPSWATVAAQEESEHSALGTAAHKALAYVARGEEVPPLAAFCDGAEVTEAKLDRLVRAGKALLAKWRHLFPQPIVEIAHRMVLRDADGRDVLLLTGTPDLIDLVMAREGLDDDTLYVWDWKAGWSESWDYEAQMRGYGLLGLEQCPTAGRVVAIIAWLGRWETETWEWSADELRAWGVDLAAAIAAGEGRFTAGDHCARCQWATGCPGRRALVQAPLVDLTLTGSAWSPVDWPDALLVENRRRVQMLAGAVEDAQRRIREEVLRRVGERGSIATEDGRMLTVRDTEVAEIDLVRAATCLRDELGVDPMALLESAEISKRAIVEIVRAKAPRGEKKAAEERVREVLLEHGAMTLKTRREVREVKGTKA